MVKAEWDGGRCRVGPREVGCWEVVVVVEGVVWHHFDHIFSLNPHDVKHVIWIFDFAKNKKKGTHNWSVDSSDWKMTIQRKNNSAMTKAERNFAVCLLMMYEPLSFFGESYRNYLKQSQQSNCKVGAINTLGCFGNLNSRQLGEDGRQRWRRMAVVFFKNKLHSWHVTAEPLR